MYNCFVCHLETQALLLELVKLACRSYWNSIFLFTLQRQASQPITYYVLCQIGRPHTLLKFQQILTIMPMFRVTCFLYWLNVAVFCKLLQLCPWLAHQDCFPQDWFIYWRQVTKAAVWKSCQFCYDEGGPLRAMARNNVVQRSGGQPLVDIRNNELMAFPGRSCSELQRMILENGSVYSMVCCALHCLLLGTWDGPEAKELHSASISLINPIEISHLVYKAVHFFGQQRSSSI